jgi:hypothetical protein
MDFLFWRRKETKDMAPAGIWQEFYGKKSAAKTKPRLRTSSLGFVVFFRTGLTRIFSRRILAKCPEGAAMRIV